MIYEVIAQLVNGFNVISQKKKKKRWNYDKYASMSMQSYNLARLVVAVACLHSTVSRTVITSHWYAMVNWE